MKEEYVPFRFKISTIKESLRRKQKAEVLNGDLIRT